MIVTLRGPGGSGKSWVGNTLVRRYPCERVYRDGKVHHYVLPGGLYVLGRYENFARGVERWSLDEVLDALLELAPLGHVFVEANVLATSTSLWTALAQRGIPVIYAFLDTPPEVCIARIYARNGGKPIKEQHVHDRYRALQRLAASLEVRGEPVVRVHYAKALEEIEELFMERGWKR